MTGMDRQNAQLEQVIVKNVAFWKRTNQEPLVAKIPFSGFKSKPYPIRGGGELVSPQRILPTDIDAERLAGLHHAAPEPCNGDMINSAACLYPEAWMEAIIGCPIYASAFSCSSKPVKGDGEPAIHCFDLNRTLRSAWFSAIEDVLAALLKKADAAIPHLHYRGVIDMLAAYLGEENLCLSISDCPEEVELLAEVFAELFLRTVARDYNQRKAWNGGFVSTWGVFAPGRVLDYQVDASNMFSPDSYQKHFIKFDRMIIRKYPYCVLHMHACGLHILDAVLEIEDLKAIEITLEKETGAYKKDILFNACKKIQARSKSLIIHGELSDDELTEYRDSLNPAGLALFYWNPAR